MSEWTQSIQSEKYIRSSWCAVPQCITHIYFEVRASLCRIQTRYHGLKLSQFACQTRVFCHCQVIRAMSGPCRSRIINAQRGENGFPSRAPPNSSQNNSATCFSAQNTRALSVLYIQPMMVEHLWYFFCPVNCRGISRNGDRES